MAWKRPAARRRGRLRVATSTEACASPGVVTLTFDLNCALAVDHSPSAIIWRIARKYRPLTVNMVRLSKSGDMIELTPPLVVSEDQIGEIVGKVGRTIKAVA